MNSRGAPNPHRITIALDRARLFGPSADAKLGAVEPDLDNWEAGRDRPTEHQLRKLAAMANLPVTFFYLPDDQHPRIIVALVRLTGRGSRAGCLPVISMDGEPDAPQQSLFADPGAG